MSKFTYNTKVFTDETALSYYLLGVWYTDGNISKPDKWRYTASLTSKDYDWLKSIANVISPNISIQKSKQTNCYRISFGNKIIYDWLFKNGCVPNKSLILKFPKHIPDKFMPDFLRGVIDGDGSISLYKSKKAKKYREAIIQLCSAAPKFINGIQQYLKQINIKSSIKITKTSNKPHIICDTINGKIRKRKVFRKNPLYTLNVSQTHVPNMINYLYYNKNILCLNRKRDKAIQIINHFKKYKKRVSPTMPSKEMLKKLINMYPLKNIVRKLKTSRRTLDMWIKKLQLKKKPRGYWMPKHYNKK